MSCSCGHCDLGLEDLEAMRQAAVAAGHMTAEQAEKTIAPVKAAREVAGEAITRLEPRHISGFPMLITILETALQEARAQQWISEIRGEPQKPLAEP